MRIANLALRMLQDKRFDVPRFLAKQKPRLIGIDLHWMPHCHGAIEVARIAKQVHPDVPVILGGLSSTYFHEDLLRTYPEVDFVLRGDSTEPPLHQLLQALADGRAARAPSPTSAGATTRGNVRVNPLTYIPDTLDYVDVRPELLIQMAMRHRDLASVLPFNGWLRHPTTMVLPLKGCAYECTTCGSSATTCGHLTLRKKPVYRSPASLAKNLAAISRLSRGTIVIPGDLLQGGRTYATEVIDAIAAKGVKNDIMFEFFDVPPIEFLRHIDAKLPTWSFEVSPESHDRTVRHAHGGPGGLRERRDGGAAARGAEAALHAHRRLLHDRAAAPDLRVGHGHDRLLRAPVLVRRQAPAGLHLAHGAVPGPRQPDLRAPGALRLHQARAHRRGAPAAARAAELGAHPELRDRSG